MTTRRPFGVTLLALLALLAAIVAGIHTLQMLHLLLRKLFRHGPTVLWGGPR